MSISVSKDKLARHMLHHCWTPFEHLHCNITSSGSEMQHALAMRDLICGESEACDEILLEEIAFLLTFAQRNKI